MDQAEQLRNIVKMQSIPRSVSRVITVTSGKGGVGKTSIAVNLALQLQRMGKKVVILDADFGLANIEVMLGVRPTANLADLMFRGRSLTDIVMPGPEGIGFISGGSGIKELTSLKRDQIFYVMQSLAELDNIADIVLVDTGAGIAESVLDFAAASEEILLVATPEPTSITDAYALLKTLNRTKEFEAERTVIKLIANRVNSQQEGQDIFYKLSTVAEKFLNIQLEYLGAVVNDESVSKAIIQQKPLLISHPSSAASNAIRELVDTLEGEEVIKKDEGKGIKKLFTSLIHAKMRK
ncbi:MAG: MinD/ParA family protein [Lachnospiraceae bacterium]|jgi:flagellar biosynthesis protein FlhG|nr:MinD/ParA family protein [Lachnospiraceae bacterium]